jgi:hypothetical protein
MKWLRDLLKVKSGKRVVYTLDKEGGLVVSRALLIRRQRLSKQAKAVRERHSKQDKTPIAAG